MLNIPIKNEHLLSLLKPFEKCILEEHLRYFDQSAKKENAEKWISDEYMKEVIDQKYAHSGYPEVISGYDLMITHGQTLKNTTDPRVKNTIDMIADSLLNIQASYTLKSNALCAVYPPGGFISWHNNANAPGFNVLFTYSEGGNGWFKYYDLDKKEVVTMPDVKGWQCKAGYYGSYQETDKVLYHAAYTDDWRVTVAFVLDSSEMAMGLHEELIEDISNNF